ncbi:hypothetical protein [Paucisalibacillus globulus]|jgi:hypothetical protein|uniref:hypothetical protein n=1 Tax=Paucisalibacillus globulus TaxID=351095 RepID=UPI0004046108|nr:hypothetical protein [Paucisalibacillus globulus]
MSGPSLKQLHAHHAIHAGALAGAIAKTEQLKQFILDRNQEQIKNAVYDLIDYWETRIISHADAEEEEDGFYEEILEWKPQLKDEVTALKRDHTILRIITQEIRDIMVQDGYTDNVLDKFLALIIVNEIHSRDEERILLED